MVYWFDASDIDLFGDLNRVLDFYADVALVAFIISYTAYAMLHYDLAFLTPTARPPPYASPWSPDLQICRAALPMSIQLIIKPMRTASRIFTAFFLLLVAAGSAAAQSPPRVEPDRAVQETSRYLSVVRALMSQCENASWVLWYSNSYADWRKKKYSALSINFSSQLYPTLLPAPAMLGPELGGALSEFVARSSETIKVATNDFRPLADYINAQDYKDDNFKKGDDLNAKLLSAGRACYTLVLTARPLYSKAQRLLAERAIAARADLKEVLTKDYARALALNDALAKHPAAMAEISALVEEITKLVEARQTIDPTNANAKLFYSRLNDYAAIPLRRLLREAKNNHKLWTEAFAPRPRTTVDIAHDAILKLMAEDYAAAVTR